MPEPSAIPPRPITWQRARAIFGNPAPPPKVTERQFDYFNAQLRKLARTPYEQIDFADLWYYHHDLAYVPLQPDLFAYLFPVCLMDWHDTLLRNQPCSHGDSEFHYGLRQGRILETMLSADQLNQIIAFFRDSFLMRLDQERGFVYRGMSTPAYGWIGRFNSLGQCLPDISPFWDAWWRIDTPGRAVATLQYVSDLMYFPDENPLFPPWTPDRGGGGPYIWANDSIIFDTGWTEANLAFLRESLTTARVVDAVARAANRLAGEPEQDLVRRIAADLADRRDIVSQRVSELPQLLAGASDPIGWSA